MGAGWGDQVDEVRFDEFWFDGEGVSVDKVQAAQAEHTSVEGVVLQVRHGVQHQGYVAGLGNVRSSIMGGGDDGGDELIDVVANAVRGEDTQPKAKFLLDYGGAVHGEGIVGVSNIVESRGHDPPPKNYR